MASFHPVGIYIRPISAVVFVDSTKNLSCYFHPHLTKFNTTIRIALFNSCTSLILFDFKYFPSFVAVDGLAATGRFRKDSHSFRNC